MSTNMKPIDSAELGYRTEMTLERFAGDGSGRAQLADGHWTSCLNLPFSIMSVSHQCPTEAPQPVLS